MAACNHVHCDHLNVTLACLYCSFNNTPKMHWYSASAWEHHTCKLAPDNLPIHPDDPAFFKQFANTDAIPSTSKLTLDLPQADVIHNRAKAAKQFLEQESDKSTFPSSAEHSSSPPEAPKHCTKQGPVKSSKNERKLLNKKLKRSVSKLLEPTQVTSKLFVLVHVLGNTLTCSLYHVLDFLYNSIMLFIICTNKHCSYHSK